MKQDNYLILLVILVISIILAVTIPKTIFNKGSLTTVEEVPIIRSYFPKLSSQYFNKSSIDLSPYVQLSNNNNKQPFIPSSNSGN
jgi:hypothetical protein